MNGPDSSFRLVYTLERIHCLKAEYHIVFTEDVLENDEELRWDVKEVMEVIMGLLMDRIKVDDTPDNKRARMKKFIKE
ncbi:hypothetical protein RclHR1_02770011 [Rhizophagus clarus]|uniref:Uncharacterized protein n=1 Tax=Rhizophagus clarus TaxID=94130 RepID=A0A2Z6RG72_9GLOM|nr:hypothetical protein RclHR1_02770011 [Rhizophagus clarus]GES83353.1 hypothetical protein GLOIN_2v1634247 [Rhizophagus clarus]